MEHAPATDVGRADHDEGDAVPESAASIRISRWQKVLGVLGLVVVVWVGSELYDVIFFDGAGPGASGSGGHGPSQGEPPAEREEPERDTGGGGGHRPPPGGHG